MLTEKPHRHDFEELIIGFEGIVEHFIDFKTTKIEAPFIIFVTKGKVHQAFPRAKNGKCSMWVINFKSEFIADITYHLYSLFHNRANIQIDEDRNIKRLVLLSKMIKEELYQENADYAVMRKILQTIFAMIEPEVLKFKPKISKQKHKYDVFIEFLSLLEKNYSTAKEVGFYAKKLCMTSRNLNLICNKIYQQSVSEIITNRKLMEAKNLLINTSKSISEIAFEVGYNEKSYFSNVFKKKSGYSPSEFRKKFRK